MVGDTTVLLDVTLPCERHASADSIKRSVGPLTATFSIDQVALSGARVELAFGDSQRSVPELRNIRKLTAVRSTGTVRRDCEWVDANGEVQK